MASRRGFLRRLLSAPFLAKAASQLPAVVPAAVPVPATVSPNEVRRVVLEIPWLTSGGYHWQPPVPSSTHPDVVTSEMFNAQGPVESVSSGAPTPDPGTAASEVQSMSVPSDGLP